MDENSKQEYWGEKYKKREEKLGSPETFIINNIKFLKQGSLLDFACGDGRNAIYFAGLDYKVLGVDFSKEAIKRLNKFKGEKEIPLKTKILDLEDIEKVKKLGKFNNIIISNYKPSLEILKELPELLGKHGILIISTFNYKHAEKEGFPKKFALKENELIAFSHKLLLLKYESYEDEKANKDGYIYKLKG